MSEYGYLLNNKYIFPPYTVCLDLQCPFFDALAAQRDVRLTSIILLINNKDDLSPVGLIKKSDKKIFSEPLKQRTEITHYTFN